MQVVKFPCTRKVRQTGQFIGTCENLITFRNKCLKCKGGGGGGNSKTTLQLMLCSNKLSHFKALASDFQDFFGNLWLP